MKWYKVVSAFDNFGNVRAAVCGTVEAESMPENAYHDLRGRDVYVDWFASLCEAQEFAAGANVA